MFEIYTEWVENPKDCHKIGRELILKIASEKLGHTPEIKIGKNGKPYIDGLHFNLSHSGNLIACAFSDDEVGIDVEKIRSYRPRVLKSFHPAEVARVEKSEDKDTEFYKIWTMKEAYLKFLGTGITKDLSFNVFEIPNIRTEICDGYVISICTKEATIV